MSAAAGEQSRAPPAGGRRWYRLHAATWIAAAGTLVLMVLIGVPGQCVAKHGPGTAARWLNTLEHGWPLVWCRRTAVPTAEPQIGRPGWTTSAGWWLTEERRVTDLDWGLFSWDAVTWLAYAAGIAIAVEWRMRRQSRFWHVSLRELLLLIAFVGMCLGWWAKENAQSEAETTALLTMMDAQKGLDVRAYHGEYTRFVWLRNLTGFRLQAGYRITCVGVSWVGAAQDKRVDARILRPLSALECMTELRLSDTQLAPRALAPVATCSSLTSLRLLRTDVDEAQLEFVGAMHRLERLHVCGVGSRITNRGLATLAALTDLRELDLSQCDVTDAGLVNLVALHELRRLDLSETPVTATGVTHLNVLPKLEILALKQTNLEDDAVEPLSRMTQLRELHVWGTSITDEGLRELARRLPDCRVTPDPDDPRSWPYTGGGGFGGGP
jgi:hypothetical protein